VPEGHVQHWGAYLAVEMGDSYLGLEHAFLAMIRNRETVPARALAGLADLDALEAAVLRWTGRRRVLGLEDGGLERVEVG